MIALVNLILLIICQPWMIYPPCDDIGSDALDPSELDFADVEGESAIPWKDTLLSLSLICLLFVASRQLATMTQEMEEFKDILESLNKEHESILEIKDYYEATNETFASLETKSKTLRTRMNKGVEISLKKTGEEKIKEDLEFVQSSWFQQYSAYSILGIDQEDFGMDVEEQLKEIKNTLDQELNVVEKYIGEDRLSLDDVVKDIAVLQNHFGNVNRG